MEYKGFMVGEDAPKLEKLIKHTPNIFMEYLVKELLTLKAHIG